MNTFIPDCHWDATGVAMTKLWAMRGYSGSGKSTKAREIADANGAVVVCRDDLRKMLLGSYWTGKKQDEDRVTVAEQSFVDAFLRAGTSVVIDATHLNPAFLRRWARLATKLGVDFEVVDVHSTIPECRQRDHARMLAGGRYVGDKVIEKQAKQWPVHKWPTITAEPFPIEPAYQRPGLPEAIICDIDGTLAHIPEGGRSPFDYSNVLNDEVDWSVAKVLYDYKISTGLRGKVFIVSGRDHTCREDTLKWLNVNNITFDTLLMRDANDVDKRGNKRPDYMVKYDIFNEHIRDQYNVAYVLDDRKQVVDMWRRLGLKCLQVQDGDF